LFNFRSANFLLWAICPYYLSARGTVAQASWWQM